MKRSDAARSWAEGSECDVLDIFARPTMEPLVEVETVVGPLLLPQADQVITQVLADCGEWEPAETRYLNRMLRAGQTFVDVGAHVGYFSVLAAGRVGATGTVIAVEPEERNLDLLHRNLARNGCHLARVIPFAAGSATGWMSLAIDEENRGAHRLVGSDDPDAHVRTRCVRLDEMLPSKVDLIKVDAQGYDHEVVDGLQRSLAANPDAGVLVEFSRTELDRRGLDRSAVLAGYEALGFTLSMLDGSGSTHRVSATEVLAYAADPAAPDDFSLVLTRHASPPFTLQSRPRRLDGLAIEETADGLTVSQPVSGGVHQLNPTAAVVFDLCTGERSVASIVELIQRAYELAEPPTDAVEKCLDHLRRAGVVI